KPLVLSYIELRRSVGIVGLLLPILLLVGGLITKTALQCSISDYFYTKLVSVFVGSLCAISVFLWSYRGYEDGGHDKLAARLASIFALGVALFPTSPCDYKSGWISISTVHYACAALLFAILAYFCLKLFTLTKVPGNETHRKLQRNQIYRACGWTIILAILLIPITKYVEPFKSLLQNYQPEFWLESAAVMAFGFAWLIKGESFFTDN